MIIEVSNRRASDIWQHLPIERSRVVWQPWLVYNHFALWIYKPNVECWEIWLTSHDAVQEIDTEMSQCLYVLAVYVSRYMSSSCRAISTDISGPLLPHLLIVHCFWQVLKATSRIGTELLYVGSSWTSCLCLSMWRGLQEYITYELVPTSPVVSCMSGSSW